jgi:hypothetical protein
MDKLEMTPEMHGFLAGIVGAFGACPYPSAGEASLYRARDRERWYAAFAEGRQFYNKILIASV